MTLDQLVFDTRWIHHSWVVQVFHLITWFFPLLTSAFYKEDNNASEDPIELAKGGRNAGRVKSISAKWKIPFADSWRARFWKNCTACLRPWSNHGKWAKIGKFWSQVQKPNSLIKESFSTPTFSLRFYWWIVLAWTLIKVPPSLCQRRTGSNRKSCSANGHEEVAEVMEVRGQRVGVSFWPSLSSLG